MAMALIPRMAEAYWAPRRSIRRLLSAEPTLSDGVLMALAGMVLGMALTMAVEMLVGRTVNQVLAEMVAEQMPQTLPTPEMNFELVAITLMRGMGVYALMVGLAVTVGRGAGGAGNAASVASAVGWWFLATTPATLIQVLIIVFATPESRGSVAMGLTATYLFLAYQLAAFLAETHGFKSVRLVLAVMFVVFAGVMLLLLLILSPTGMGVGS